MHSLAYQVPAIKGVEPTMALTLTRLPVFGTFLSRLVGIPAIIERGESFGTESEEERRVVAHFTSQFKVKGTERMMRDMIIGDALSDRMADHEKIAARGMRVHPHTPCRDFLMICHTVGQRVADNHVAHHALRAFDFELAGEMRHHAALFLTLSAKAFSALNNRRNSDQTRQKRAEHG